VTWTATGGTITTNGLYTAGMTSGTFTVTATSASGPAGSSTVTIPAAARTYSTNFPLTENPIAEGGQWINGGAVGLDWANVATTPGLAMGMQTSGTYNDATAILQGPWAADQRATATVYSAGGLNSACGTELELRLRSAISSHGNRGYEIGFGVVDAYVLIVRWNGALGDFTVLHMAFGDQYRIRDGDVVSATAVGNVITAYKNGAVMAQVTDGRFPGGSPGLGMNLDNSNSVCHGINNKFGFRAFSASDIAP
jgi:hypothetical protein